MFKLLIRGFVSLVKWGLCGIGVLALVVLALLATPLQPLPELQAISRARATVDLSSLPAIERFQARDGTWLGFRHYGVGGAPTGRVAIVIHGSSGSSGGTIHALSQALAAHGVETFAVDMRGHGTSGTRGDIGYVGQLEDDLADFVAVLRSSVPSAPLTLIGHSSGGGFALRTAGSPMQNLFERFVLLAPYLGYDAPSTRPSSGGWARADIPRIIGLLALRKFGITCCEALPVLALAVPPNSEKTLVSTYTDRLMRNFAVAGDFRHDLAAATKPLTIISGADDELMFSDKYAEAVRGAKVAVDVRVLDGINHMGIVAAPKAVSIIAEDVATRAMAGS
ncbi:alpha/beta fold hydrolase [Bradyrhizobium sp. CSA112]|uniref:alpha/beta fold hydrolase n=1 Tax=Bradyrhizobium sp. CSA112 TaxID=2699170 RepID=UPI0023B0FA7F|nr:alpha/beta fold hydrolase [Bradyrhizobium sp. CSA112]MDE5457295.1 alpha/beta fold hydrolase [Bradyrhizobium sp. CSA112]